MGCHVCGGVMEPRQVTYLLRTHLGPVPGSGRGGAEHRTWRKSQCRRALRRGGEGRRCEGGESLSEADVESHPAYWGVLWRSPRRRILEHQTATGVSRTRR